MTPSTPFVDRTDGTIDTDQVLAEAVPLAKLVGTVAAVALVPFLLAFLASPSFLGAVFAFVWQFVLAVGSGIVLIYVVARAIELTGAGTPRADGRESSRGE